MFMLNTFQQGHHAMLPETTHDERARQEFTKSFKQFIQGRLLPGLTHAGAAPPKRLSARTASRLRTATICAKR